ncbi:DUF1190 domain-containing protein [Rothia nasimurium]|uniref:DUF1190 domain-containing protein n=1 Tax=Rothia nasimurium TaxID=85336 RepID=UPI001F4916CF|nr:DUF1190 domain-containing protein [Rothia nasimurium]
MKRVMGMVVVGACLVLAGCSSAESEAVKAAQAYVTATRQEQCELDLGRSNCEQIPDNVVWPGHPTDVESVTKWKDNGYAVVIPDADGRKDVFGLREVNGEWKVEEYDVITEEHLAEDDPACWALSEDTGIGC